MADKSRLVRHLHAAQPDMVARAEAMHVETHARPRFAAAAEHAFGPRQVGRARDLDVVFISLDQRNLQARPGSNGNIVGVVAARGFLVGVENSLKPEGLRRLCPPEPVTGHGLPGKPVISPPDRVGDGESGEGAGVRGKRLDTVRNDPRAHERSRPVMDQHEIGRIGPGQRLEPGQHRGLPCLAAEGRGAELRQAAGRLAIGFLVV